MAEIIKMPRLSDTMEEGNIVEWLKNVGDKVAPGDVLAEVETDKATMELESFQNGVLLHIEVDKGAVPVDGVIAVIGNEGEDFKDQLDAARQETSALDNTVEAVSEEKPATPEPKATENIATQASSTQHSTSVNDDGRIKASPLAKSMAEENNINLSNIAGSGDGGRIIKKDIETYLKNGVPAQAASGSMTKMITTPSDVSYGDQPVSQMRKVIAKRLAESKYNAPHFYLTIDINMDNAVAARNQLKAAEVRVSFNDIVIKACASALRKHPMINSSWLGDTIRVNEEINIGVAVAVSEGLLVPVVRNADQKSLTYINQEVRDLAGKARDKKLQPDQMTGNTFTISNLGSFGIDQFTAIINPPDACILAVGQIAEKAIVVNGEIKVANIMNVTLSCDHRVVDGAKGAEFLDTLKKNLENPLMMMA